MSIQGEKVAVYGLELHYIGGTSDKFYRVFVIESTVLIHYGARDTAGQCALHPFASQQAATGKAREMADAKEAKGYRITREFTAFPANVDSLPNAVLAAIASGKQAAMVRISGHDVTRLVSEFKAAAASLGHVLEGADR